METDREPIAAKDAAIYNAATTLTLARAVLCGYASIFVLLLLVSGLLIEGRVFQSNVGQAAAAGDHALPAWPGASIATVAGALGSKLESIEQVGRSAYGHDQRRRDRDGDDNQGG